MAANMNNIAAQRNMPDVPQATTPKISTGDDAEQAALDKMKQKNPKLAGMMAQAGLDDNLNDIKPDNTVPMPKRNVKPRNAGKNAFGQMAQNLGKVAEGSRFDRLNFLFESIIAEAEQGDTQTSGVAKKSISQWVVDFFKKFMKGEDITSDPTIMQNVTALSKELEQNYTKDKVYTYENYLFLNNLAKIILFNIHDDNIKLNPDYKYFLIKGYYKTLNNDYTNIKHN